MIIVHVAVLYLIISCFVNFFGIIDFELPLFHVHLQDVCIYVCRYTCIHIDDHSARMHPHPPLPRESLPSHQPNHSPNPNPKPNSQNVGGIYMYVE